MQEHRIRATRSARYFTLGRVEREIWFVLHGYGQLAARFLRHFEPIDDGTRLIVAPEGLSRFYLTEDPAERRVGATWMTREDRLAEIDDYVHYLDAVYVEALGQAKRSGIKVVLLGFSQGSSTACRWATLGASQIDRLIVWGGEVPPDLEMTRALRPALVFGSHDEYFTPKVITATEERLRALGVSYDLVPFEGGHEIDPTVLQRLAG
jgi:predicted esterase